MSFLCSFRPMSWGSKSSGRLVTETTVLGAAYAAGHAVGFWSSRDEMTANWSVDKEWQPAMDEGYRNLVYTGWKKRYNAPMAG